MKEYVFNNENFDNWLNKKSDEILYKVERESISNKEILILLLKARTATFHQIDIDFKKGITDLIDRNFTHDNEKFKSFSNRFKKIDGCFNKIDRRFEKIDQPFECMDQKIDNRFMWMIGIVIAMYSGIYLKLFLG